MVEVNTGTNMSVTEIARNMRGEDSYLTWQSRGNKWFLILFSEDQKLIDFSKDYSEEHTRQICDRIDRCLPELLPKKRFAGRIDGASYQMVLYSYVEFCQNGGLQIKKEPGVYCVYGAEIDERLHKLTILTDGCEVSSNSLTIALDFAVSEKPFYQKKGIFNRKKVYSGFHVLHVEGKHPDMPEGSVRYTVRGYVYPIPLAVIRNGGAFYVRAEEHDAIHFETNVCGLQIKAK